MFERSNKKQGNKSSKITSFLGLDLPNFRKGLLPILQVTFQIIFGRQPPTIFFYLSPVKWVYLPLSHSSFFCYQLFGNSYAIQSPKNQFYLLHFSSAFYLLGFVIFIPFFSNKVD